MEIIITQFDDLSFNPSPSILIAVAYYPDGILTSFPMVGRDEVRK
jgi:hypothetical protein